MIADKSALQRFEEKYIPVPEAGCWLWLAAVDKNGYGKTKFNRRDIRAHRWSWILHRGEIPDGLCVLHRCDTPCCVNPDHLFLGTQADNDQDKRRKGREYHLPIFRNPKLTAADVLEIRRLRGSVRIVDLAARFGVHHGQISRIQRGLFWAHTMERDMQMIRSIT